MTILEQYAEVVGESYIDHLRQLAAPLRGVRMVHVNSTKTGGGVAEILDRLIPMSCELGIDARWEVIEGNPDFYLCTKGFHNGLQGHSVDLSPQLLKAYEKVNRDNAERLAPILKDAEVVFIHDPQPAPLLKNIPGRKGKWAWRCHIDASRPYRPVWRYLRPFVGAYDVSIWSLSIFAQPLDHAQYLIPPSIDPFSEKNMDIPESEINSVCSNFGIDRSRPIILQVSRFDRFKDPVGVIVAYRLAKKYLPALQLVLAGGGADDDPEGEAVLREVMAAAQSDTDIKILSLPPTAHRTINALQRAADIVLQKSLREGFGLTVTEAMWKRKPVIGGNTGGIRLQAIDHYTGFLVSSPEGASLRIRYLLEHRNLIRTMGENARKLVRDNFLLTRHLREYLTLTLAMTRGNFDNNIELA